MSKEFRIEFLENYNGDPKTIIAKDIVEEFYKHYKGKLSSISCNLSKFKGQILLKTKVKGYKNGKKYNECMRKDLKETPLLYDINNVKMKAEDASELAIFKIERRDTRASSITYISKDTVETLISHVNKTYPKDIGYLIVGLLITTGRRSTEITKSGIFKEIPNDPYRLSIKGTLKKCDDTSMHEFPTLIPAKTILKGIKKLRAMYKLKDLSNEEVEKLYGSKGRYIMKKQYGMTLHSLRSIYVSYLHQYQNPDGHTKAKIIKDNLSHKNMDCNLHYSNFEITEDM